jgi:hypothetical protein
MALNTYSTGTVAVTTGGAVTVSGGIWTGPNVVEGDMISIDGGAAVLISDVTDATHGQLVGWSGGAVTGKNYVVYKCSSLRFDDVQVAEDAKDIVAALNTEGFYHFVPPTATVPDPSLGDDGQYAFQATTGKLWLKSGGLWSFVGVYKGVNPRGAWSSATAYAVNDVVSLSGSAYMATAANTNSQPPSANWMTLGAAGTAATIAVGTVTSGNPGLPPDVSNSGTSNAAVLDFTIPRAAAVYVGSTTTGAPGSSAAVTDGDATADVQLNFTIPRGDQGEQGIQGIQGPIGKGLQTDAVGTLAGRSAYDAEPANFVYLSTDGDGIGDVPVIFVKASATSGDWSPPMTFSGDGLFNKLPETIKTADYTVTKNDAGKLLVFNKATAVTANLSSLSASQNETYFFLNVGAGTLTVVPDASETVEGTASLALSTGTAAMVWPNSDKTSWRAATVLGEESTLRVSNNLSEVDPPAARKNLDVGILGGFRDKIINGAFDIDQAGVTVTLSGFVCDQWEVVTFGSGATDTLAIVSTPNAYAMKNGARGLLAWQRTAGTSGARIRQKVEGVQVLNGREVTLAIRCYDSLAVRDVTTRIDQSFGAGGAPSADVVGATKTTTVGTDGANPSIIYHKMTLASIEGKSIGSNNDDCIIVNIDGPASGEFSLRILQVSLMEGDWTNNPRIFDERRPYQVELDLCRRYYERIHEVEDGAFALAYASADFQARAFYKFAVEKFKNPTFSHSGASTFVVSMPGLNLTPTDVGLMPSGQSQNGATLFQTVSGATAGVSGILRAAAGGAWIEFDSRL